MNEIIIYLPWPPTINSYYKPVNGGLYLSKKGRMYREAVAEAVREQVPDVQLGNRVMVEITMYPPDNRTRDLDNYKKALFDSLTHCDIWEDDSLIDQDFTYRGVVVKGGVIKIEINQAGPIMPYNP